MRTARSWRCRSRPRCCSAALFFGGGRDGRVLDRRRRAGRRGTLCGAGAPGRRCPCRRSGARGRVALLATAFVVWNGLTILWSVAPDRSWDYFNRGLVYLAFARRRAVRSASAPRAPRLAAWLLGGLVARPCRLGPGRQGDAGVCTATTGGWRGCASPVGYWNALALVAVFGLPLALWAATRRHSRPVRAGAVVALYVLLRRAAAHVLARGDPVGARRARDLVRADSRAVRRRCWRSSPAAVPAALVFARRAAPARDRGGRRSRTACACTTGRVRARRSCSARAARSRWRTSCATGRARSASGSCCGVGCWAWRSRASPSVVAVVAARGNPFGAHDRGRPGAEPARRGQPRTTAGTGGRRRGTAGWAIRSAGPARGRSSSCTGSSATRASTCASRTTCRCSSRPRRVSSGSAPVGRGDGGGAARSVACAAGGSRRRAGSGACAGHRPARVPRPRAARLRLGLRRAVRGRLLRDRVPARDRSRADSHGPRVRHGSRSSRSSRGPGSTRSRRRGSPTARSTRPTRRSRTARPTRPRPRRARTR